MAAPAADHEKHGAPIGVSPAQDHAEVASRFSTTQDSGDFEVRG